MYKLVRPTTILFDWHATLVNTRKAMYHAFDDMLSQLEARDLIDHLVKPGESKTIEDAILVDYVKRHQQLHPKLKAEQRVSRSDLLEVLFGSDENAKHQAHETFNECYRKYYGEVIPLEQGITDRIRKIIAMGMRVGIVTNRNREFLEHELGTLEQGSWTGLFEVIACGDDVPVLKPNPGILLKALDDLDLRPDLNIWYVGDSTTDVTAAKKAGISAIFYNGANWEDDWLVKIFPGTTAFPYQPDGIVNDLTELVQLVQCCIANHPNTDHCNSSALRIFSRYSAVWQNKVQLAEPEIIVFDWHATLANTLDAMYHAVDDLLPQFDELGLIERLIDPAASKTVEDAKLVEYVQDHRQLHPKIKAARKISRTDIFEVLFGGDEEAKKIAHDAFNLCYRNHFGMAHPIETGVRDMLMNLNALNIKIGVLSNRDREFLEHELNVIEDGSWVDLFGTVVGGDDTENRKPAADPIEKAIRNLGGQPGLHCWYVGDSTTDIIAAKTAGVTSIFYNGAKWEPHWLAKIFPGTSKHPHQPDCVVNDFSEFLLLVRRRGTRKSVV